MPTNAEREQARKQRRRFTYSRKAETWYAIQLRKIAHQIGALVGIYDPDDQSTVSQLVEALRSYARIILPWARNTATRMLADVANRDRVAWQQMSRELGIGLRTEIASAPTGELMRQLLAEQVSLITSIPLDAAMRVQKLALEGLPEGSRGGTIVDMIMQSGQVSKSRATLIARTETARVSSVMTQARAVNIGSEGYIWRAVMDADTRPELGIKHFGSLNTLAMGSHRRLNGTYHRWDDPPIAGTKGERSHPGQIYNCRCYAEPVIPNL